LPSASEIRRQFLDYFAGHGHRQVASAPLVPKEDPTLLFTNAGMVQFKAPLLGLEKRDYNRAVTSQKCFRASGKHNDLENVGFTNRHHTFFEMLGNFSFGDYFKEGAIEFCWELLTVRYGLDPDKLWVSIHYTDDEAEKIWRERIGVPPDKIVRLGDEDNFWAMGETGPCGPCSEVHIDQGPAVPCPDPANCGLECECDRFLELWNLVFMQSNRDDQGNLTPLPKPSIDTGLGLERISAVLQGVYSNYETDLFLPIMEAVGQECGTAYHDSDQTDISLRVIADHARAVTFLISDGVLPSNEGRGYVLRRVLRRAVRHGRVLGLNKPFLAGLSQVVGQIMADQYPEINDGLSYITKFVEAEERRFSETLDIGLKHLNEALDQMKAQGASVLPGQTAFKLYDTYGFPLDLIVDVLRDEGLSLDTDGFEKAMGRQKAQSRAAWKGSGEMAAQGAVADLLAQGLATEFVGYDSRQAQAKVVALVRDGQAVETLAAGQEGKLITDRTPFYAEAGGQVGDSGRVSAGPEVLALVPKTVKYDNRLWVHRVRVEKGRLSRGDSVQLKVDDAVRDATEANHTATHLLQRALREFLGDHVKQAGSLVSPDRLRFDFTHFEALGPDTIAAVEKRVNEFIWANLPVCTSLMSMKEAQQEGAIALFEETYGETVRLVRIGDQEAAVSKELCGGTHVQSTAQIGLFKIVSEESAAAGVRRIEAVTRFKALELFQESEAQRLSLAGRLKTGPDRLGQRVDRLLDDLKARDKEIEQLKAKLTQAASGDLMAGLQEVKGVPLLTKRVQVKSPKELRDMGDRLRDKLDSGVALLGASQGGKAFFLALVSQDLQDRFPAGEVVQAAAQAVGGGGGGRRDMAQAGGPHPEKMEEAFKAVARMIEAGA